tara:strand:- start:378 stop:620 length:243 start_codon:yes stop_codon:yes gene_type:complete
MISIEEAKWLFWFTRNTNLYDFAKIVFDIENIYDSPQHEKDYIGRKYGSFVTFGLGTFDDEKIQRIIDATYAEYDKERKE